MIEMLLTTCGQVSGDQSTEHIRQIPDTGSWFCCFNLRYVHQIILRKDSYMSKIFLSGLLEASLTLKNLGILSNNPFSGPVCQVPAQVTAAWEGADNHFIIPRSGPGLNCLPREHSGGLEKISRKYGKQSLRPLYCH